MSDHQVMSLCCRPCCNVVQVPRLAAAHAAAHCSGEASLPFLQGPGLTSCWPFVQVLPGPSTLERMRLALLFDSVSGELLRGMRAWREIRCADGRFAELDNSALAAAWAAAVAPSPAARQVELRELGLTVHAAVGGLTIEADGGVNGQYRRLVVRRSFDNGACASKLNAAALGPVRPPTACEAPLAQGPRLLRTKENLTSPFKCPKRACGGFGACHKAASLTAFDRLGAGWATTPCA